MSKLSSIAILSALCAAGLTGCDVTRSPPQPSPKEPAVNVGRYQIASIYGGESMLIDTAEGKTWRLHSLTDQKGRMVWVFVPRLDDKTAVKKFVADSQKAKPVPVSR